MATSYLAYVLLAMPFVNIGVSTPLDDYVNAPDPHYSFQFLVKYKAPDVTIHVLNMTSQKWLTERESSRPVWWHYLCIVIPDRLKYTDTALMWIDGGHNTLEVPTPKDKFLIAMSALSATTGSVVAIIKQIPNQPIQFPDDPSHEHRTEDAVIAWTWMKFIENGSKPEILLQLPMTKAVVRGMDTVSSYVENTVGHKIDKFVVSGASKRGWTAWTVAAVDKRIVAMIPVVLDLLNLKQNLHHHFRSLGGWTFAFKPYYELNITKFLDSPNMARMQTIIDPMAYNDRYTLPKLIVSASGDEFFLPDDSHYYYGHLQEPKYLKIVPNAEHSLLGHILSVLQTIRAFYLGILEHQSMPRITWTKTQTDTVGKISVKMSRSPTEVSVYHARTLGGERRDFRLLVKGTQGRDKPFPHPVIWFKETAHKINDLEYEAEIDTPKRGWAAFFIRMTFDSVHNSTLDFTTETCIVPDTFPFSDCSGESCYGTLV